MARRFFYRSRGRGFLTGWRRPGTSTNDQYDLDQLDGIIAHTERLMGHRRANIDRYRRQQISIGQNDPNNRFWKVIQQMINLEETQYNAHVEYVKHLQERRAAIIEASGA